MKWNLNQTNTYSRDSFLVVAPVLAVCISSISLAVTEFWMITGQNLLLFNDKIKATDSDCILFLCSQHWCCVASLQESFSLFIHLNDTVLFPLKFQIAEAHQYVVWDHSPEMVFDPHNRWLKWVCFTHDLYNLYHIKVYTLKEADP